MRSCVKKHDVRASDIPQTILRRFIYLEILKVWHFFIEMSKRNAKRIYVVAASVALSCLWATLGRPSGTYVGRVHGKKKTLENF